MKGCFYYLFTLTYSAEGEAFPGGSVVKSHFANAGDVCLILGQEDPMEEGNATLYCIVAWEVPWTEEPPGQPTVLGVAKQSDMSSSD